MTNFQKALSVCMSLCFFIVLAVLPRQFLFRKNVYRQLPLYCFLEEYAAALPFAEDKETYEKIVAANGEYLGEKIRKEQLLAQLAKENEGGEQKLPEEGSDPAKTPKTAKQGKKSQKTPKKTGKAEKKKQEQIQEVAAIPHPVIDLSLEKLADGDYLLNQFFVEDEQTKAFPGLLNAARFLEKDLTLKQDASRPQILIYHTHATETFADSVEGREKDTIVGVGNYLKEILEEKYGYNVLHVKEAFDMAGGVLDRNIAYDYAHDYLVPFLEANPSIEVILDLHRDGVSEDRHLVTNINGKKTAQVMFYNGISYTKARGTLDHLPNPYIEDNLAFSFQMEYLAAQYYPDFYRCIYLAGYRYNQHLRQKSMLLEVGAQTNTVSEAKNAMEPFAELLNKVLQNKRKY